jgi:hypothetical protein
MDMKVNNPQVEMLDRYLMVLALWGLVKEHKEILDIESKLTPGVARQHRRTLLDSDTGVVSLLLLRRHMDCGGHYTLGELARTLAPKDNASLTKSAQQKLKMMLERMGTKGYDLFCCESPAGGANGKDCYRIYPSQRLLRVYEESIQPKFASLIPTSTSVR